MAERMGYYGGRRKMGLENLVENNGYMKAVMVLFFWLF